MTVSVLSSISALRFVFTAILVCNWLTAGKLIFTVKP
ncbi:putative membrane protein, partial [Escherichia coli B83]